jgi:hypothetical protein
MSISYSFEIYGYPPSADPSNFLQFSHSFALMRSFRFHWSKNRSYYQRKSTGYTIGSWLLCLNALLFSSNQARHYQFFSQIQKATLASNDQEKLHEINTDTGHFVHCSNIIFYQAFISRWIYICNYLMLSLTVFNKFVAQTNWTQS